MIKSGNFFARQKQKLSVKMTGMTGPIAKAVFENLKKKGKLIGLLCKSCLSFLYVGLSIFCIDHIRQLVSRVSSHMSSRSDSVMDGLVNRNDMEDDRPGLLLSSVIYFVQLVSCAGSHMSSRSDSIMDGLVNRDDMDDDRPGCCYLLLSILYNL